MRKKRVKEIQVTVMNLYIGTAVPTWAHIADPDQTAPTGAV